MTADTTPSFGLVGGLSLHFFLDHAAHAPRKRSQRERTDRVRRRRPSSPVRSGRQKRSDRPAQLALETARSYELASNGKCTLS